MKLRFTALVFLAASGTAMAQDVSRSTVVLYGRLDTSIDSVRFSAAPGAAATHAINLSKDTCYWGVRGIEDLGGDLHAYFKLESGFFQDTGELSNANVLFSREAYVGLGGNFGSVQLGSQYSPALLITIRMDPFQRVASGSIINLMQKGAGNKNRGYLAVQNNAIHYVSPNLYGLTARAMYGLSERTVEPKDLGQFASAALEYAKGPFYGGFSYEEQKVASVPPGATWNNKTYTLGTTYNLGFMKLHGYLLKSTLTNSPDAHAYMVGLTYPIGHGMIRTAYSARKVDATPGSKTSVASLGYTYDISKRSTLYTTYSRLENGIAANVGLLPSTRTYGLPVNGQDVGSVQLGMRHVF